MEKLEIKNFGPTTHSPYTLTTLNNLMYDFEVGKMEGKTSEVAQIIPEELWLNPEDAGAWYVDGGTVRSIKDEETKQIKAEEIDLISEELNHEYDQIMDIKR